MREIENPNKVFHVELTLEEVAALKAQVNCLREALKDAIDCIEVGKVAEIYKNVLEAVPEQCLAEVKAKAVEEAIKECTDHYRDCLSEWTALDQGSLKEYPNKLRKKAKEKRNERN